jgi:hypothetical protein
MCASLLEPSGFKETKIIIQNSLRAIKKPCAPKTHYFKLPHGQFRFFLISFAQLRMILKTLQKYFQNSGSKETKNMLQNPLKRKTQRSKNTPSYATFSLLSSFFWTAGRF